MNNSIVEFLNENASMLFVHQIDLEIVFPAGDASDNTQPLIVLVGWCRWEAGSPA